LSPRAQPADAKPVGLSPGAAGSMPIVEIFNNGGAHATMNFSIPDDRDEEIRRIRMEGRLGCQRCRQPNDPRSLDRAPAR
jgi:hypothetical protein